MLSRRIIYLFWRLSQIFVLTCVSQAQHIQGRKEVMPDLFGNAIPNMDTRLMDLLYKERCNYTEGENIWQPGDMNAMYESILEQSQYSPTILSRPPDGPWIIQMEDFLSPRECHYMIMQALLAIKNENPNFVADANEEPDGRDGVCVSTQAWCSPTCMTHTGLRPVWQRIEELVKMPFRYAEPVHFIQYVPGQEYGRHHDYSPEEKEQKQGPRLFTILFYLNDIENGDGGETCFSDVLVMNETTQQKQQLCVTPKAGRAIIWPAVLDEQPDTMNKWTWHAANGIATGYKYASAIWYHLRDYAVAHSLKCVRDYYPSDDEW